MRTNIQALSRIRTHGLRVQVIKAYASDRTATETGSKYRKVWPFLWSQSEATSNVRRSSCTLVQVLTCVTLVLLKRLVQANNVTGDLQCSPLWTSWKVQLLLWQIRFAGYSKLIQMLEQQYPILLTHRTGTTLVEVPLNGITSIPNFMKICQAVQKISIDPLYLELVSLASVARPAPRPTQPPVQWVSGVKCGRGVTLTTYPRLVLGSRMSRNYEYVLSPFSSAWRKRGSFTLS
jgi:hypothetical protein